MVKQKFFYLNTKGKIFGPLTAAQLRKMYQAGRINASDTISVDKIHWQSAAALFSPQNTTPQPVMVPPVQHVNPVSPAGLPSQPAPQPNEVQYSQQRTSGGKLAAIIVLMIVFIAGISIGIYFLAKNTGVLRSSSKKKSKTEQTARTASAPAPGEKRSWSDIIKDKKDAVGVVFIEIVDLNNAIHRTPVGTAWAIGPDTFATNAHVILSVQQVFQKIPAKNYRKRQVVVVTNEVAKRYPIDAVKVHPQYQSSPLDSDFAILQTPVSIDNYLTLASYEELLELQPGNAIAYLGFPMEGLHENNLNFDSPVATLQPGEISAISDISYGNSGKERNTFIRHNLPTVGGASGSPVFANNGKVIAIVFAGNMNFRYDKNGKILREPSAAQINFAIRIDRIKDCQMSQLVSLDNFLGH